MSTNFPRGIEDAVNWATDLVAHMRDQGVTRKEVSKMYDVDAMPVTVLVDREGNVRFVHQGYKPGYEEKYLDQVRALLRE